MLLLFLVIASKIIAHACIGVCLEGFLAMEFKPVLVSLGTEQHLMLLLKKEPEHVMDNFTYNVMP